MNLMITAIFSIAAGFFYSTGLPHAIIQLGPLGMALGVGILFCRMNSLLSPQNVEAKKDWISILFFLLSVNLFGYYWIPYTISEFGGIYFPFNYLLSTFFSLIILPQYIAFIIILKITRKYLPRLHTPLYLAILICTLEILTPQQFPAHLGHSWLSFAPYLPFAPIFGVPFYSFILYWPLLSFIRYFKQKVAWQTLLPSTSFLLIVLIISILFPLHYKAERTYHLKMVQANIGNNLKIDAEKFVGTAAETVQELYLALSKVEAPPVDLIIWPETAYPRLLKTSDMLQSASAIPLSIAETVIKNDTPLFTGGYDLNQVEGTSYLFEDQFNSAFYFVPDASKRIKLQEFYHKSQLIPFGETLPFGPFNHFLGKYIRNISFFAQGQRFPLFYLKETPFIAAICYEVLFPNFIRSYLNLHQDAKEQPQFLINISNDSWYGDTIEPEQHLFLTHWRSLENQLPIVRMTNTGISSILYPDGSESARSKKVSREVLNLPLELANRTNTWFQRFGYLSIVLLWLGLIATGKAFFKKIM